MFDRANNELKVGDKVMIICCDEYSSLGGVDLEKIKDVAEPLFTFIQYILAIIFSIIAGISILFILPLFIAMIAGYPYAFTGFCISIGSMFISIIILSILDLEEGQDTTTLFF